MKKTKYNFLDSSDIIIKKFTILKRTFRLSICEENTQIVDQKFQQK